MQPHARLCSVRIAAVILLALLPVGSISADPSAASAGDLDDLIAEALSANPAVEAAHLKWEASQERSTIARSWPDPMLTYGYFAANVETRVGAMNQKVTVAQKIPYPGKLSEAGDMATQEALIAMWQYRAKVSDVIQQTKSLYFELYLIDGSTAVVEEQTGLLDQMIGTAQHTFEAGSVGLQDVLKARLAREELRTRLVTLSRRRAGIEARLNALLARPRDTDVPAVHKMPALPELPPKDALQSLAETHRQELQQAGVGIARDEVALSLARKDRLPDLTVGIDYTQVNRNIYSSPADNGRDAAMLFFSINVPLHRDKLRAEEQMARKQLAASQENLAGVRLQVQADVDDAWAQARGFQDELDLYRRSLLPQAEDTFAASSAGYSSGNVGLISVLDSERTLLGLKLGVIQNEAMLGQALAKLERSVGTDLSQLTATPESTTSHALSNP